ncbi:unnamed protein product [Brassicogethes aeneus]|uniref:RING-type E3 ubiquitin transferase n=1 Tax=Brassicogethes aeneus TaxID=1431903 RepID=A0A9P0AQP7_BRAAE|nr:unnamed protein product [Brassicogethes aeneus]
MDSSEDMYDDVFNQFTENLLSQKVLLCCICEQILISPVKLVQGKGNVCAKCFDEKYKDCPDKGWPNPSLDIILSKLTLPCKYSSKGCELKFSYHEHLDHISVCSYRLRNCPMNDCLWKGHYHEIITHFKNIHGAAIINADNGVFTVKVDFSETAFIKLLWSKNYMFYIKIHVDMQKNKLIYMLCAIRDSEEGFKYTVKHKGDESDTTYIKTNSQLVKPDSIYNELNSNNSSEMDLDVVKAVIGNSQHIINVFKLSSLFTIDIHDKLLHLECPVCRTFMKTPIFQCRTGHSICNKCYPRLEKCPTCSSPFGSTRNYALEALTSGVLYPCTYFDMGCSETNLASQIVKHEEFCSFRPMKCPIAQCSVTGNQETIIGHIRETHGDKLIATKNQGYTESYRLDQLIYNQFLDKRFMIVDNRIFRVSCKRTGDHCFWAVEIFGSGNERKTYVYEITIMDVKKPEKKITRTDYCLNEMAEDELFRKCIMFPNTILCSYSSTGLITFNLTIKIKALKEK